MTKYFLLPAVAFSLIGCATANGLLNATASPVGLNFFTPTPGATAAPTVGAPSAAPPPVAARVNGTPILLSTLSQDVSLIRNVSAQGGFDGTPPEVDEVREQVLNKLIDQLLIEQQAELLGLNISAQDLAVNAQTIQNQAGSREKFEAWLADNSLTEQQFLDRLDEQLTARRLYEQITSQVPDQADQISLRYMWITEAHIAQEVEQQIVNQQAFSQIIEAQFQKYPDLLETGRLDWFPEHAGYLPAEVEPLVFKSQPGDIIGPTFVSGKYFFAEVEEVEYDRPLALDRKQALKQQVFLRWLHQKRTEAQIEQFVTLN